MSPQVAEARVRVGHTPGSLGGILTARKRHLCQSHLADDRHYIEPGDRYYANALPPDHPDIGNSGWWHYRTCMECCPVEFAATPDRSRPGLGTAGVTGAQPDEPASQAGRPVAGGGS